MTIIGLKKNLSLFMPRLYKFYRNYVIKEKKVSWGNENPDKTFYIIGQNDGTGGLWWIINKVLMHIWYAEEKGYIPVIDLKNYKCQYSDPNDNNTNVWELFFKQPCGYSLDDISKSKNVIMNKEVPYPSMKYIMGNFYDDGKRIEIFRNLFQKYIYFNEKTLEYLNKRKDSILHKDRRVLGILCRGTDYVQTKPKGHPIQPEPQDVIREAELIMKQYQCEYIFLATEDKDIFNQFQQKFGTKLLFEDQQRWSKEELNQGDFLAKSVSKQETNYWRGVHYLTSTYILSNCTCYLAGRTGGSKGVLIMNRGFEYQKIYDLGLYE